VELEPPRNKLQTVSANCCACPSSVNVMGLVAPPMLMVTIFPFDWQVPMSEARKEQSGRFVPGNVPVPVLHV